MDDRSFTSPPGSHFATAVLATALSQALRDTLFSSGGTVSPGRVHQIGQEMSAAFLAFYESRDSQGVELVGRKLAFDGLGPRSILPMTEALRVVCGENADAAEGLALIAGEFSSAALVGYMAGREEMLLSIQERTHQAYVAALLRRQGEPNPAA